MIGEFCREAGLLVLVFGILDAIFQSGPVNRTFWTMAISLPVMGIVLLITGISIERKRTIR